MLLRLFRTNGAQMIVLIPIIGILLWLGPFLKPSTVSLLSDTLRLPLYDGLFYEFIADGLVQKILAFLMVIAIAFLMVRLNTRYIIINNRTYLPAIIYVIVTSGIPVVQKLNPALVSAFIILLIVEIILDSYRFESLFYGFFTAAFLLGVGTLIYPFLAYFMIFLWAGIILLRKFNWREWVFTFLGFILPLIFAFSYYYLFFDRPLDLFEQYEKFYQKSFDFHGYNFSIYLFFGVLTFILLFASQFLMQAYSARKILSRRAFSTFFWLFLNTVAVYALINQASVELIYILAIPISFLLSNYWAIMKSVFWGNIFLMLLLASVVYSQLSYYLAF